VTPYTIGHGRRSWEEFLDLINSSRIDLVVNVRRKPVSRWAPWANRKRLGAALGDRYLCDGARLGNPVHFGAPPITEAEYSAALDDLERRVRAGLRVAIMC
jgi:Protein of unknown function, DUF488